MNRWFLILATPLALVFFVSGCNTTGSESQNTTKDTPVVVKDAEKIPDAAKSQVDAAKQKEQEKMSAYSKSMSDRYSKNPPVAK